ncbi:hypothetical protein V1J52_21015 [Streptomyces sp. TRM 70351]|uniref:hypothetical protein n=1 Tax=Streptomyces sp. TRM 70351 TaxID=3116552 RepID=UPI002E7BC989|nr:hypothetical protein [Streptomyces sp. TRM 70351]MEE1930640.1 hypothetical protein [Streptomyces sp. TRM 70351]
MTAARAHARTRSRRSAAGETGPRLRWWALPLPVTVFAALLTLLLFGGGEASAGTAGQLGPAVAALWEELRHLLGA